MLITTYVHGYLYGLLRCFGGHEDETKGMTYTLHTVTVTPGETKRSLLDPDFTAV